MKISDEIVYRSPRDLRDHPENDKYNSPLTKLEETTLRASIAESGVQEPLLVRTDGTVISGHQRKRISVDMHLEEVPTREVSCTDKEAVFLLVSSNEARRGSEKDLIKKALRVDLLYSSWEIKPGRKSAHNEDLDDDYDESVHGAHFDRHDVAKMMNLDDSTVRRLRKLLQLLPEFQVEVSEGRVGLLAGNRIASLSHEKQQKFLAYYYENGSEFSAKEISEAVAKMDDVAPHGERQAKKKKEKLNNKLENISKDLSDLSVYALDDEELYTRLLSMLERKLEVMKRGV